MTVRPIRYRQVVVGAEWSCGLADDFATYCWGDVLPLGIANRGLPIRLSPELRLTRLEMKLFELCALSHDGVLYCTTSSASGLGALPGGPYRQVSPGTARCAITVAGATMCGGSNSYGNVGVNSGASEIPFPSLVTVPPLLDVDAGLYWPHTCGVTFHGEAWCWGRNANGELGNGTRTDSRGPVRTETDLRFRQVHAGVDFTCGITLEHELWCWGRFPDPDSNISRISTSPFRIPIPGPVLQVDSGGLDYLVCARTENAVWCWGGLERLALWRVEGFPPLADMSVGEGHVCGTTHDGQAWCAGMNYSGQLGDGTLGPPSDATRVADHSR
jgi:alpha-tubulin suppressor-like RCC1 family protein